MHCVSILIFCVYLDSIRIGYGVIMKKLRSRPLPHYLDQAVSAPVLPNQVREVFEQIPDPSCSALNSPACGAILDRDV